MQEMVKDFRRDWRKWTGTERVMAVALLATLAVLVPTTLAMTFGFHTGLEYLR